MPRYFFHLRYGEDPGEIAHDDEGDEFSDAVAARAYAVETARDLMRTTRLGIVENWLVCSFEVSDETGAAVADLAFGEALQAQDRARIH